jgi:hypothetical protein
MTDSLGRRARRPWTAKDDDLLRKFHREGKGDTAIAYIMDRARNVVRRRRIALKLPKVGKPGPLPGWKHTPEAKAKISEGHRRRWQKPGYKEAHAHLIHHAKAVFLQQPRRITPPRDTPEGKLFRKLADALGAARARREMNLA